MSLSGIDVFVLVLYLIFSAALGAYFAKFQRGSREYFLGNRDISWPAVSLSIVATETSTLTFIGVPALAYGGDMTFLQITFGYLLARIAVSYLFLPLYFKREIFTAYNFIAHRFGEGPRRTASGIFLFTRLLADGVRLFATAIPLSLVTGLSYPVAIGIICLFTLFYTYLGGLRAVIWMDVIQIGVYLLGAVVAIVIIAGRVAGGLPEIVSTASALGKFNFLNLDFDIHENYTIYSGIIGGTLFGMASHGTDQLIVQRLLACRTVRDSQKALISSGVLVIFQFLFFLFIGIMLFAFYQAHPERLSVARDDAIFPLFIANELPPGIGGLIIAAIFAAAMSTLSSSLNSLASSTIIDWVKPLLKKEWSEKRELFYARGSTILWGLLLIFVATIAASWGNVLEAGLSIASITYGGLLGAFLLGLSRRSFRASDIIIAMLSGFASVLLARSYAISWPWFVLIGASTTVLLGYLMHFARREGKLQR